MKRFGWILFIVILALVLGSCSAEINPLKGVPGGDGEIAGFWMGLWHGLACPFMFLISLFKKGIGIYETHNNGNWYNFGFLIGLSIIFGGGGRSACKQKRCRES